jgi:hypothetical protein
MRKSLRFSPVALLVLAACSGGPESGGGATNAPATSGAATPVATSARVTHLLPRGGESTASIQTLPNAVCTLRATPGAAEYLTVFADDDGIARLHLQQVDLTVDHGELALECVDDAGTHLTHTIDVQVDDAAVAQAPAPYLKAGKPTLPVLDVDPMSIDGEEILARGYPPRPDPNQSPAQYASWLGLVASGATKIAPHLVVDPSREHGPARITRTDDGTGNSNNWSGYVITTGATASKYAWIYGEWNVPRAYAESGFASSDHSTMWVGIDGWGTPDVVQDGTDQDTLTAFWIQTSSYDAWTEWYPLSSQSISNFPVNPGDDLHVWTWTLNSAGQYSATATVGWFYLWNATQNVYSYTSTTAPSGTTFNGHTAEWVMERPTVNGSVATLAQYTSPTTLANALAYDLNGAAHYYTSDNSTQVSMVNSSTNHVLSTVKPVSSESMAFTWVNHQ